MNDISRLSVAMVLLLISWAEVALAGEAVSVTTVAVTGRLQYHPDEHGDTVPDFSWAGFRGGGVALPQVPVRVTLNPVAAGDDGTRIQAALDQCAKIPPDVGGMYGAVLLKRGVYRVDGSVRIPAGVVLRGEGQDRGQTEIIATGTKPRDVVIIDNKKSIQREVAGSRRRITDERAPVGSHRLKVEKSASFKVGDHVVLYRPSTTEWIHALGMDRISPRTKSDPDDTKQWIAGQYDLFFPCKITAVDDTGVVVDVPLMMAIESVFGGGSLAHLAPPKSMLAGVESLRITSEYQVGKENEDEAHATYAVAISNAVDCWVRDVTSLHFVGGCVSVGRGARRITVQDCACLDPVSQITGGRRYSFSVDGHQVLVQRCYARNGRHDFVTGSRVPGPNAFVDCLAEETHSDCGPHHRWAVGILYDNLTCGALNVQDRGYLGSGHGWAGANHVLWNCTASSIVCQRPPTAQNWAIGCIGRKGKAVLPRPEGRWESLGMPVLPRSLYLRQLEERLGAAAVQMTCTAEQRAGSITATLRQRFAGEAAYSGRKLKN
jgi:hypothetical protein